MRSRWSIFLGTHHQTSGFLAGLISAFLGSALFSSEEIIRNWVTSDQHSYTFLAFIAVFIFSFLFSSIPACIAGWFLGCLLQDHFRAGSLTLQFGKTAGVLLAGAAGLFTCCIVIVTLQMGPSDGTYIWYLNDLLKGHWFVKISSYMHDFYITGIQYIFQAIIATAIATIFGRAAGMIIAKETLAQQPVKVVQV